jgi:hypothetical protein
LETIRVNPRHPSLRAKKYEGGGDLWQARGTLEKFPIAIGDSISP